MTLLFEALALSLCQDLAVRQAVQMLRVNDKQLWRRIEHYVEQARAHQDMSQVRIVGVDETSVRRGQQYITVVHDLQAKRLLAARLQCVNEKRAPMGPVSGGSPV